MVMPALAELQQAMGQALLARDVVSRALPTAWFNGDASGGLKVHRNTIIGACCAALRLSYPTVERVLGAPLFESLAADYARAQPPAAPALDEYGEDFAAFMVARATPADAPLLRELAHYDWLLERVTHARCNEFNSSPAAQLEGGLQLYFATSLRLCEAHFAVEQMRAAVACSIAPGERRVLAVWRREHGVAVSELRPPAAAFTTALLLQGTTLEVALQAATVAAGVADEASVAGVIAQQVFQSGFVRLKPGD
jgi:hypothetical protein